MNSLCWEGFEKKVICVEGLVRAMAPPMVFIGLWSLNIVIVAFGLPVLLVSKARRAPVRQQPGAAGRLSKPVHP